MNPNPVNPNAIQPNPYLPPTYSGSEAMSARGYRVEGNRLVVRTGAVLPPFCVKTNEPVAPEDLKAKTFTWCSPLVVLLFLISGLIAIIVYFIIRKTCVITFGLTPERRTKYRNRLIIKSIVTLVCLAGIIIGATLDSGPVAGTSAILFLVALIVLIVGNSPLSISTHRNGEFWVAGCSREFLMRLQG